MVGLAPALVAALLSDACASSIDRMRLFPDRPAAWHEHDDADVAVRPERLGLEDEKLARLFRLFVTSEADRALSFEPPRPAEDVNALDEVPCSTWFCPRNHVAPMSPAARRAHRWLPPCFTRLMSRVATMRPQECSRD
jgi:hypothetical protein